MHDEDENHEAEEPTFQAPDPAHEEANRIHETARKLRYIKRHSLLADDEIETLFKTEADLTAFYNDLRRLTEAAEDAEKPEDTKGSEGEDTLDPDVAERAAYLEEQDKKAKKERTTKKLKAQERDFHAAAQHLPPEERPSQEDFSEVLRLLNEDMNNDADNA